MTGTIYSDDTNIVLMLSHESGRRVAEFFSRRNIENIVALYLEEESAFSDEIIEILDVGSERVFFGKNVLSDNENIKWLHEQDVDFLLTVYWPWLLDEKLFSASKNTMNFHPALLPVNRGWYPHVHSILDGSKCGVTLHQISKDADQGDVWVQKEVVINDSDTAEDIYIRLQDEICDLFSNNWENIRLGRCKAKSQEHENASYHAKNELALLDKLNLDEISGRELFNLLRARSFGNRGFAYIENENEKLYLNLRIGKSSLFE